MKPICILVTGVFASGKTRTASTLSHELNLPNLSKDHVKEILFDTLGFTSREEKVKLGNAAQQILLYTARELLMSKRNVILENNFETKDQESLINLLNEVDATCITVMLKGDLPTLYQRFIQRNHSQSRHPGHVTNRQYPITSVQQVEVEQEMTLEQFEQSVKSRFMTTFHVPGHQLELDVTNWDKVNLFEVVQQLQRLIQEIQEG